jgi:hypothetical protein
LFVSGGNPKTKSMLTDLQQSRGIGSGFSGALTDMAGFTR